MIEDILRLLNSAEFDIYHRKDLINFLTENGYIVTSLKKGTKYFIGDAIVLRVERAEETPQTLKVHPDIFFQASKIYNSSESLERLATSGSTPRINYTCILQRKHKGRKIYFEELDRKPLRIVMYDFLQGVTLTDYLSGELKNQEEMAIERAFAVCINGLMNAGFEIVKEGIKTKEFMVLNDGRVVLTDVSFISRKSSNYHQQVSLLASRGSIRITYAEGIS